MKYGISVYDALLESPKAMQLYLDNTFNERFKAELWKQFFTWDLSPSLDDGFKAVEVVKAANVMADIRARFSPVAQRDTNGLEYYLGTVPDLSHGFKEGVEDRVRLKRIAEMAMGNEQIIAQFTHKLEPFIQGIHSRITNMGMQLISKGEIYDANTQGTGIPYKSKAPIPTANFKTAGAAVWSDNTNAKIFTDMINTEKYVRDTLGYQGLLEWNVDKATMTNILNNKEVKDFVGAILTATGVLFNPNTPITMTQLDTFIGEWRQIAPIKLVEESQTVYNPDGNVVVNGWKAGSAVLRPAGRAGVVKYSLLEELMAVQGEAGINITYLEGGRIGIKRKFNAATEQWSTDVLAAAVPTLSSWRYHVIVDSTTAEG